MPYPKGQPPLLALAGRKRLAAERHDARAAEFRAEADAMEAEWKSRCTSTRPGKGTGGDEAAA